MHKKILNKELSRIDKALCRKERLHTTTASMVQPKVIIISAILKPQDQELQGSSINARIVEEISVDTQEVASSKINNGEVKKS